jgi:hypothetical protein
MMMLQTPVPRHGLRLRQCLNYQVSEASHFNILTDFVASGTALGSPDFARSLSGINMSPHSPIEHPYNKSPVQSDPRFSRYKQSRLSGMSGVSGVSHTSGQMSLNSHPTIFEMPGQERQVQTEPHWRTHGVQPSQDPHQVYSGYDERAELPTTRE